MATHFHSYKKSTLPPLLDRYLPVNFKNQINPNQRKIETSNKGRTRNDNQALSDEEKEELIKQALQEKRYLETYKNLCKLRKILCERYRTLLNEKVQKQRIQIKMFDLKFQQELKPKAKKLIGLQNELTKLGMIKNQQDYEDFWKLACNSIHGSNLKEKLPDIKAKMFATKPVFLSNSARTLSQQQVNGSTNGRRLKKSSVSPLRSTGTRQPPTHHEGKQMNTHQETEQMFPKSEPSERQRKNEKHLSCVRHMYYFSLSNMALSKRLLEENGQFDHIRREQTIHDLMEYLFPSGHEGSGVNQNRRIVGAKQQEMHHKDASKIFRFLKENKTLKQEKEKELVEITEDEKNNFTPFTKYEMIPVPLTLEDVALFNPVLEAKLLGNYWTNYADQDPIKHKEKY